MVNSQDKSWLTGLDRRTTQSTATKSKRSTRSISIFTFDPFCTEREDRQADRSRERQIQKREDRRDRQTGRHRQRDRQTDTEKQRQKDRERHTQRGTERERQRERDRQTETQRERDTDRERHRERQRQRETQREAERERKMLLVHDDNCTTCKALSISVYKSRSRRFKLRRKREEGTTEREIGREKERQKEADVLETAVTGMVTVGRRSRFPMRQREEIKEIVEQRYWGWGEGGRGGRERGGKRESGREREEEENCP